MSKRELCDSILDTIPEYKMGTVLTFLQGFAASEEAEDDAFCERLARSYDEDADPESREFISLEEACKMSGVDL